MDNSDNQKCAEKTADSSNPDMDALLDSALGDFDKPIPQLSSSTTDDSPSQEEPGGGDLPANLDDGATWSNEFEQFQDTMKSFFSQNPELKKELEDMAKSTDATASGKVDGDDFAASLVESLKGLVENTQNMPDPPVEELSRILADLGMGDTSRGSGDEQIPDLMPFMHSVMQNLLSKELLYPALKDIVEKYPDWLTKNQDSVEQQQFEKYSCQYELMKEVCSLFETEDPSSDDDRQVVFEKVFTLMQKMQNCGQPPKELMGDMAPDLPFDEHGNLKLPGMSDQCSIM